MLRLLARIAFVLAVVVTHASVASAQVNDLELTEDQLRNIRTVGDKPVFCSNGTSILSEFEGDVAAAIAGALFLDHEFYAFETVPPTPPLDFRLALTQTQIFLALSERCDALMGYTLLTDYRDWMVPSLPYLSTRTVLAVREDSPYQRMADIPFGQRIGTRMASLGDNYLANWIAGKADDARWRRTNYPNHQLELDRLIDGSVEAALVWEPALARYRTEHPDAAIRVIDDLAFPIDRSDFVLALRSTEDFFNSQLNQAIRSLVEDGTMERLAAEHGLPALRPLLN